MAMNSEIIKFAAGNDNTVKYFDRARDYIIQRFAQDGRNLGKFEEGVTLSAKAEQLNKAFFGAVEVRSGVARTEENASAWMAHPSVRWAAMSIIDATVNTLLPITTFPNMADFVDFKSIGYGDVAHFKVMPRELFVVSRGN